MDQYAYSCFCAHLSNYRALAIHENSPLAISIILIISDTENINIIRTCSFSFPYRTEVVERYSAEKCRRLGRILIRQSSGFISNVDDVTWHPPCAYVIEVPLGQRINVTLLDFAYWSTNQSSARCEELAVIKEGTTGKNAIACRDGVRDKVVFLSHSNIIEVVLLASHPSRRFLLHYEGEYTCIM